MRSGYEGYKCRERRRPGEIFSVSRSHGDWDKRIGKYTYIIFIILITDYYFRSETANYGRISKSYIKIQEWKNSWWMYSSLKCGF